MGLSVDSEESSPAASGPGVSAVFDRPGPTVLLDLLQVCGHIVSCLFEAVV